MEKGNREGKLIHPNLDGNLRGDFLGKGTKTVLHKKEGKNIKVRRKWHKRIRDVRVWLVGAGTLNEGNGSKGFGELSNDSKCSRWGAGKKKRKKRSVG